MKFRSLFQKRSSQQDQSTQEESADSLPDAQESSPDLPQVADRKSSFGEKLKGLRGKGKSRPDNAGAVASNLDAYMAEGPDSPVMFQYEDRGVLSVGKKRYAIGLIWVPTRVGEKMKSHAEAAGKIARGMKQIEVEYSLVAGSLNDDLIGFGAKDLGHARGMPSLVKSINVATAGSKWLIAIKAEAENLWWVGSVRDDVVFLDRIFSSDEEAMIAFSDAMAAPGWNTIIAPAEWNIQGSLPFLGQNHLAKSDARLRVFDPVKAYGGRVAAVVVLGAGIAGGVAYYVNEQRKFEAEQAEMRARIERAITLEPADHPWFARPTITGFLEQCADQIQKSVVLVAGWENQIFTCTADRNKGSVVTGWSRSGGTIAWMRASLPAGYPALRVGPNMDSVTVERSFDVDLVTSDSLDEPWSRDMIESRLAERFQARNITHTMRFIQDPRPPETNALFNRHDVQIQGEMAPVEIVPLLEDIPALIPQTLTYNLATTEWNFIFRLHHPVIIPEIETP